MEDQMSPAVISNTSTASKSDQDITLLNALLSEYRPPNRPQSPLCFLEYGTILLAGTVNSRGLLLSETASETSVPTTVAEAHTRVVQVADTLPNFETVASLLSRHLTARGAREEFSRQGSGSASATPFDVLSIGAGTHAEEICDWLDWSAVRPTLVRCDHPIADTATEAFLLDLGYQPVASSTTSRVFADSTRTVKPDLASPKTQIRTFDVFDTLIARRCVWPDAVFDAIGAAIGSPIFKALRKQAEIDVTSDSHTLDEIYRRLAIVADMPLEDAFLVRDLELRFELDNAIPITENMLQVRPSDVLVSDMYLSADQINGLLRAAGFTKDNPIFVRSRGKHTGESWTDLKRSFAIIEHLGDNRHSDHDMALRHGVPARLTSTSNLTPVEKALATDGFPCLARTIREARLRTFCDDPEVRYFQDIQTQINFPLLMVAALHLSHVVKQNDYDVALMASRDCNLWIKLVEYLADAGRFTARPVYLHTNRSLLREPTPIYAAYVRSVGAERPLFVDLIGTGLSIRIFSQRSGISMPAYFVNDIVDGNYACGEATRLGVQRTPVAHRLTRKAHQNADLIEVINNDLCGPLRDVVEIGGTFLPRREPSDLPAPIARRVRAMHEAFDACLAAVGVNGVDEIADLTLLERVGQGLLDLLQTQDCDILMTHHRQVQEVMTGSAA